MTPEGDDPGPAAEDADWLGIVASYGDHPSFPELVEPTAPEPLDPGHDDTSDQDHFVPEPAPPVEIPRGPRAAAWFGLFGVPTLVLISTMLRISLPSAVILLLLVWFVGGFGYLVATMKGPQDPDAGWDDGAVL